LYEGHGFHGTPGQVSRAVNVLRGDGFSRWGTVFHGNFVQYKLGKAVPQGLKPSLLWLLTARLTCPGVPWKPCPSFSDFFRKL
jgi:hypothetical protein